MSDHIIMSISVDSPLNETLNRDPCRFYRGNSVNFLLGLELCNFQFSFSFSNFNLNLSDIDDHRLGVAKSLGADHVIKVSTRDPEELANQVEALLGEKPDASFECSGTDFSMSAGIHVSKEYKRVFSL